MGAGPHVVGLHVVGLHVVGLHVSDARVTAVALDRDGAATARVERPLAVSEPRPGWTELAPAELWAAALDVLGRASDGPAGLGLSADPGPVVLWDRDTLGSPRPALAAPGGPVEALTWVARHEPHTWRLVEEDTYALGGLESYLLARLTRGTYHLTDRSQAERTGLLDDDGRTWSDERCRAAGVPVDALPELGASWGWIAATEPGASGGLDAPVTALLSAERAAGLVSGLGAGGAALGTAYAAGLGLGWWGSPPAGVSRR